ncbi:MAG TPA: amidohydrolase family protein, partial [Blastocatellia bacterium]
MIDAHFHIWKLDRGDYDWLTPSLEPIYRDIAVEDWKHKAERCGVTGGVMVQAAPSEAETDYILARAAEHPGMVLGVVGWVDMSVSDAPQRIETMARNPLLKGLRPMLQDIPDPNWILHSDLAPALDSMCELGLTFDALIKPVHLSQMLVLAARFPQLRIVVDHGAKPDIASGAFQPWAEGLQRIAQETGVYCKLSGLLTEAGERNDPASLRPYADHIFRSFGPERVLWGSDWPVLELAGSYEGWHKMAVEFVPDSHREAVFEKNAVRAY